MSRLGHKRKCSILSSPYLWEDEDFTSINLYYGDLSLCEPFPTKQDEWEVGLRAVEGDEGARDQLATRNLRFAFSCGRRYRYTGLDIEDLIAEANLGLLEATSRFKPKKNVKFITYAQWWIRARISRAVPTYIFPVTVPAYKYEKAYRPNWAFIERRAYEGDPPRKEDTYLKQNDSLEYDDALRFFRFTSKAICISILHEPHLEIVRHGKSYYTLDRRQSTGILERDRNDKLFNILKEVLTQRELDIIMRYYGFRESEETLRDIGKRYKLSRERIRQLREEALSKLRKNHQCKRLRDSYWQVQ